MKRKLISTLLFGAMFALSAGTFVSCDDYDDDISDLNEKLSAQATDLSSLVDTKVATVTSQVTTLESQVSALDAAYKTADEALQEAIDKAAANAKTQADNAEQAAKDYADIQAASAQTAAIAAAKEALETAKSELEAALEEVNTKLSEQGKTIETLVEANATLDVAVKTAQARADEAYELATQAKDLAQQAYDDAQTALANADYNLECITNLQSSYEQLSEALSDFEVEFLVFYDDVYNYIGILSDGLDNVMATAAENAADIDALSTELTELAKADSIAHAALSQKDSELAKLIEDNQKAIEEKLENEVKALKEDAQAKADAAKEAAKLYTDQAIEELTTQINNALKGVNDDINEVVVSVNALDSAYQAADAALENKLTATIESKIADLKAELQKATADSIANLNDRIDALVELLGNIGNGELGTFAGTLDTMNKEITTLQNAVAEINKYLALADKYLKSLVFSPTMYYEGVEAIDICSYEYTELTLQHPVADVTNDQTDDYAYIDDEAEDYEVVPFICAQYFLNPSNAEVDMDDMSKWAYIVNNAELTTRAQGSDITVDSVKYASTKRSGEIDVYFSLDGKKLLNDKDGKIDVAALRYTYTTEAGTDTTITSDFAALKKYVAKDFIINKVTKEGLVDSEKATSSDEAKTHLVTTAAEAIAVDGDNALTDVRHFTIAYNNENGIDFDQWINVHYTLDGEADVLWGGQKTVNAKNFKLNYELIGYLNKEANNTNESTHAKFEGSVLKAYDINGKTGAEANRSLIGRRPLVRVTLTDGNNNALVAVGYVCVDIVDVEDIIETTSVNLKTYDDEYVLACADDQVFIGKTTWDEIESKVLSEINNQKGVSKIQFEEGWTFDKDFIYVENAKGELEPKANGTYTFNAAVPTFDTYGDYGTIAWSENADDHKYGTNVLAWALDNSAAYSLLVDKKMESISVYAHFTKNGSTNGDGDVYIKLTWKPKATYTSPSYTVVKTDKVAADWHKHNSRAQGTTDADMTDVHMQIGSPTSTDVAEFNQYYLDESFNWDGAVPTNKITAIVKASLKSTKYKALADDVKVLYQFVVDPESSSRTSWTATGESGKSYTLTLSSDNLTVNVGTEMIATIDEVTGQITINEASEIAKDLINYPTSTGNSTSGSTEKQFTLYVQMYAETCEPVEGGEATTVKIINDMIYVKVIKPLYVTSVDVDPMQLNKGDELLKDVQVNFVDFTGNNPAQFEEYNESNVDFFEFYKITEYDVDEDNVTTDYSGSWKPVDTNKFTVDFTAATEPYVTDPVTGNPIIGTVELTQVNMSMANTFHIRIPVAIKYVLGTLNAQIEITVKASAGKEAKRQ